MAHPKTGFHLGVMDAFRIRDADGVAGLRCGCDKFALRANGDNDNAKHRANFPLLVSPVVARSVCDFGRGSKCDVLLRRFFVVAANRGFCECQHTSSTRCRFKQRFSCHQAVHLGRIQSLCSVSKRRAEPTLVFSSSFAAFRSRSACCFVVR